MNTIFIELHGNRLMIAIRIRPEGYINNFVFVEDEYRTMRNYFESDQFQELTLSDLSDISDYNWRTDMKDDFLTAYVHKDNNRAEIA